MLGLLVGSPLVWKGGLEGEGECFGRWALEEGVVRVGLRWVGAFFGCAVGVLWWKGLESCTGLGGWGVRGWRDKVEVSA